MLDSLRRVRLAISRRQVALFMLAIVVPSAVVLVMAIWMTAQDRELAQKRAVDERQRRTEEIRQSLIAYLERLKLVHVASRSAGRTARPEEPIVLAAAIDRGRIVLPWDEPSVAPAPPRALADAIRQGEHEELVALQPLRAATSYSRAVVLARDPTQRAYAKLLLARAWTKAGRHERARAEFLQLLELPIDVKDEHGVPMWAYAAQRLAADDDGNARSNILAKIAEDLDHDREAAPTARYLLRDVFDATVPAAAATDETRRLRNRLEQWIRDGEHASALRAAFPLDGLRGNSPGAPKWVLFGDPPWLVSVASASDPTLLAVPAATAIAAAVRQLPSPAGERNQRDGQTYGINAVRLLAADAHEGDWIGEGFPSVKIAYEFVEDSDRRSLLQRWFAWLIVVFSLTVTAFGAYFLWRDVRREVRVAALRSQFVASVSHELKTPLTAIRMFAETLRLGRAVDEETAAEYLDTIVNESERLSRLLNNVLEFSKMERGATHFRLVAAPLEEPVRRVIRAMSYPLEQQGFTLQVEIAEGLPRVLIDVDAIEQALLNLLTNAMKYSGDAREIALRVNRATNGVVIEVVDRGIGIAPTDRERVFEKFYRAATPENRHIPGTGLGLTLVDHIARAHGGSVRVTSTPGEGSTFLLFLPAAAPADDAAPSMAPVRAH